MIYFGIKLKSIRVNRGLTQKQLSSYLNVTPETVSNYETSAGYPSFDVLKKLCCFFDISADYLLGLSDEDRFDMDELTDDQALAVSEIINQFILLNRISKSRK